MAVNDMFVNGQEAEVTCKWGEKNHGGVWTGFENACTSQWHLHKLK